MPKRKSRNGLEQTPVAKQERSLPNQPLNESAKDRAHNNGAATDTGAFADDGEARL